RDVTPEALEPLFQKRMDGFSVLFHQYSATTIGTSTLQSRATGGLIGTTFVFALPGSRGACRDAWEGILRAQLDNRHKPCNFVELVPRPAARGTARSRGARPLRQRRGESRAQPVAILDAAEAHGQRLGFDRHLRRQVALHLGSDLLEPRLEARDLVAAGGGNGKGIAERHFTL